MDPAQAFVDEIFTRHQSSRSTGVNSLVSRRYKDSTVLVTGGAGFVGKHLLEKLIRTCNIKKAYIILRPKKGKSVEERLQAIANEAIFEYLRDKGIEYVSKLIPVEGDMSEIRVGLKDDDWNTLVEEVEYIFHAAATVNFEEPLKTATLTNVRGTREMIALAGECKKLRAFVHISTAYSHATKDRFGKEVKEEFYACPVPPDMMVNMAESLEAGVLNDMVPKLVKTRWPNTYTFTKAIAEDLIRQASDLPICIVRPAIVINSYKEPMPGYLDRSTMYGPSGLILGGAYGALHTLMMFRHVKMDLVPVDYVNNAVILAGWAATEGHQARVYTVACDRSDDCWGTKLDVLNKFLPANYMTSRAMWYYFMVVTENWNLYHIMNWLVHYIPAYFIDGFLWMMGKPRMAVKIYTKVAKLHKVLSYFMHNEWHFNDQNLMNLYQSLTLEDQNLFYVDTNEVDTFEHMVLWGLGVRKYLVNDGLRDTKLGMKKQSWLRILHYAVVIVFFFSVWNVLSLFFYILYSVYNMFKFF